MSSALRVSEIFHSLQGEARTIGFPTVFVRLTGCPLRCTYCDTTYAFTGGTSMSLPEIMRQVESFDCRRVTVTGGEPLAQKACSELLLELVEQGYDVSLETSGALDVAVVDQRVSRVVDIKTPDSGEQGRNLWSNLDHLTEHDQIKFVICSREDYDWAREKITEMGLSDRCELILSPSAGQQDPVTLAEWILSDGLPVRFQLQLHKQLWGDERAR
jgi:7-carboxy-7-deazaguanine synthase